MLTVEIIGMWHHVWNIGSPKALVTINVYQ